MIIKLHPRKEWTKAKSKEEYFDSIRKENILKYFKKREIQLFISSTSDLEIEAKRFYIHRGGIDEAESS